MPVTSAFFSSQSANRDSPVETQASPRSRSFGIDRFLHFHHFLTAPRALENGPTLDSSTESRTRAAGKMVENGDKWSKNGGACISWCARDQSTGVMTRWCSSKQQII